MLKVYGIKNCDTIKKTLRWLESNQISYTFIDYKKQPAQEEKILYWFKVKHWKELLNTKGTTYRNLSEEQKNNLVDEATALKIMLENNSIIKRPVIEYNNQLIVGFDEAFYTATFKLRV